MQTAKEKASVAAASAKAGADKTKATLQEKGERMTAHDPMEKEMATERKQEKINEAEMNKQKAAAAAAAAKEQHTGAAGGVHDPMGHTTTTGMHPGTGATR